MSDGIDRRGFLKCMQWAGAGVLWSVAGGIPSSRLLGAGAKKEKTSDFTFVQISDTHIGFNRPANTDVVATLQASIEKINGLDRRPELILHTGDLTHLSKHEEFDTLEQNLRSLKQREVFYVPGEHDVIGDGKKVFLERFGKGSMGMGWRSFDHRGV